MKTLQTAGQQISAVVESTLHARTRSALKARVATAGIFFATLFTVSTVGMAEALATDLTTYGTAFGTRTNVVVDILNYVAYIGGAGMATLGIVDLKKHVENPSQKPMKDGLGKVGFGGMLLAAPTLMNVAQDTMAGTTAAAIGGAGGATVTVR